MDYEGESLAYYLAREEIYIQKEKEQHVKETLIYLTDAQVRRIKMKAEGMTLREIAEAEGIGVNAVRESIESAKRKFKKYFWKHLYKTACFSPYSEGHLKSYGKEVKTDVWQTAGNAEKRSGISFVEIRVKRRKSDKSAI